MWRRVGRGRALMFGGSHMLDVLKFGEGGGKGNSSVFTRVATSTRRGSVPRSSILQRVSNTFQPAANGSRRYKVRLRAELCRMMCECSRKKRALRHAQRRVDRSSATRMRRRGKSLTRFASRFSFCSAVSVKAAAQLQQ